MCVVSTDDIIIIFIADKCHSPWSFSLSLAYAFAGTVSLLFLTLAFGFVNNSHILLYYVLGIKDIKLLKNLFMRDLGGYKPSANVYGGEDIYLDQLFYNCAFYLQCKYYTIVLLYMYVCFSADVRYCFKLNFTLKVLFDNNTYLDFM